VLKSHTNDSPRRILVFRIGELGDTLISLPCLWAVRRAFPNARLALLGNVNPGAGHVDARQVLPLKGLIDEWLSYKSADYRSSIADLGRLLARLRRSRFDMLIYLTPRTRKPSEVRRDLLFFRLAGIKTIIGGRSIQPLPTRLNGESLPGVEHEADHLLARLAADGIETAKPRPAKIDLALTPEEHEAARSWLHSQVRYSKISNVIAFGPGSKWQSKVWPGDRFASLGRRLIEEFDIYPVVFGGGEDKRIGDRLLAAWGRGANAAGALAVRPAAAALARCALYVGNDTGTTHLAAAIGTPCVVTMSAQDWPGRWEPYGYGHTVLRRSVPCEGCMLSSCLKEKLRCLTEIPVEEVFQACRATLLRQRARSDQTMRNTAATASPSVVASSQAG